jgi:crotonyl-CoA carboxylase/reductase
MWKNQHAPGNMSVLVSSPRTGLRSTDDVIDAAR